MTEYLAVFNAMDDRFHLRWTAIRRTPFVLAILCGCALAVPARAQKLPEDPEDEKQVGLWLDQGISTGLSANRSLETEFHERFDEGASNLFEYFVQGVVAFRLRPWFTLVPIYRYQRFSGNPAITYENRLQLNLTLSKSRGLWRITCARSSRGDFPTIAPLQRASDFVLVLQLAAAHEAASGACGEQ